MATPSGGFEDASGAESTVQSGGPITQVGPELEIEGAAIEHHWDPLGAGPVESQVQIQGEPVTWQVEPQDRSKATRLTAQEPQPKILSKLPHQAQLEPLIQKYVTDVENLKGGCECGSLIVYCSMPLWTILEGNSVVGLIRPDRIGGDDGVTIPGLGRCSDSRNPIELGFFEGGSCHEA